MNRWSLPIPLLILLSVRVFADSQGDIGSSSTLFLHSGQVYSASAEEIIYGATGYEVVLVNAGARVHLDGNIERIEFADSFSRYEFSVQGTQIVVWRDSSDVATFSGLNQTTRLVFQEGAADLTLTGLDQARMGGSALPQVPMSMLVSLDDSDRSSVKRSFLLEKGEVVTLASGAIFPGIVHDGSRLVVSYAMGNDLYVRPFDSGLEPMDYATQITQRQDVTDHKHLYLNGSHYIAFSTLGDRDLFLMRLDNDFNAIGNTVVVSEASIQTRTNDMLLASDGDQIVVGQFRPGNLNNNEPSGHLLTVYDTALNLVEPDIVINALSHVNTASLMYIAQEYYLVSPSSPVAGRVVDTQRDLILTKWSQMWEPTIEKPVSLVDSTTLNHEIDGEGLWMATGLAYDTQSNQLLLGHTFVNADSGGDQGTLYLRVFDARSFEQTQEAIIADTGYANRAHFLLSGDLLYIVYDDASLGSPSVLGLTYRISR